MARGHLRGGHPGPGPPCPSSTPSPPSWGPSVRRKRHGGIPAPRTRLGGEIGDVAMALPWWLPLARHRLIAPGVRPWGTRSRAPRPTEMGRTPGATSAAAAAAYLTYARADTTDAIRASRRPAPRRLPALLPRSCGLGAIAGRSGRERGGVDLLQADADQRDTQSLCERGVMEPPSRPGRGANRRARASDPVLPMGRGNVGAA